MNKSKRIAAALLTAVLAVSLTACGSGNNTQAPANQTTNGEGTNGNNGSNTGVSDPGQAADESEVLTDTGSYTGQIDTTSIEVVTANGPTAFQFGKTFDTSVLESLKENDAVEIQYTEKTIGGDAKQLFVTKLTKVEAADQTGGGAGEGSKRESTKDFELELEGMKETRTGKLAEGDGYSLYVFDAFTFDAKTNKLFLTAFPDYSAEIVKLGADYKLDDVRKAAEDSLGATGDVRELKGEEITSTMRDAKLFLLASTDKVTKEVIVKDIDGIGYQFNVTIPVGEASEGFGPNAFVSLGSIASK